jgi:hypothetical protein
VAIGSGVLWVAIVRLCFMDVSKVTISAISRFRTFLMIETREEDIDRSVPGFCLGLAMLGRSKCRFAVPKGT